MISKITVRKLCFKFFVGSAYVVENCFKTCSAQIAVTILFDVGVKKISMGNTFKIRVKNMSAGKKC